MKKKLLTILFCGVMFLGIIGCKNIKNEFDVVDESNIQIENTDVSLFIEKETLKNTAATFILKNNSNKNYQYGLAWELEMKEDGKWHKLDVLLNFNSLKLSLNANESKELNMNWENSYGKLAKGTYRLVKHIDYEYEEGNFEEFYVAAEFTIE